MATKVSVSSSTTHAAVGTNLQAKVVTDSQQWEPRIRIGNVFR
jgi:phage baseplate assembly protein W